MPPLAPTSAKPSKAPSSPPVDAAEDRRARWTDPLAVERPEPFASMSEDQRRLRRGLRAKARQLGGGNRERPACPC